MLVRNYWYTDGSKTEHGKSAEKNLQCVRNVNLVLNKIIVTVLFNPNGDKISKLFNIIVQFFII